MRDCVCMSVERNLCICGTPTAELDEFLHGVLAVYSINICNNNNTKDRVIFHHIDRVELFGSKC